MSSLMEIDRVYQALHDYGIVFIQPECRMDLEVAQRMTRDYSKIV